MNGTGPRFSSQRLLTKPACWPETGPGYCFILRELLRFTLLRRRFFMGRLENRCSRICAQTGPLYVRSGFPAIAFAPRSDKNSRRRTVILIIEIRPADRKAAR